jgi:benzoate-CoA ligase family protein
MMRMNARLISRFWYNAAMAVRNLACVLLDEALERGAGDAAAIREPKRVWTYGKLAEEAGRAASAFSSLGIRPGERIVLLLHDSAELAAAWLGAVRMGAVPAPLATLLRAHELRALAADAQAVAVVTSADLAPLVDEVRGELPSVRHHLAVGGALAGQADFHALTREADPHTPAWSPSDGAPAFLLYSAGAGRTPRGIAHDHAAPIAAYESYASLLGLAARDLVFCTTRLSTAYGLGLGLLFPLLARAATCLLPARPRPRVVFDVLAATRPTIFAATPSLYGQLMHDWRALDPPRPACFESVRHVISGGEALPESLARRFRATFGKPLLHGFGATEALHFVLSNRPSEERDGSAGRTLPGVEARLVDDAGAPVAVQEIGIFEVRGPTTKGAWVRTGDRFFADESGHFFHCGRTDDLFKVSGRWVSPGEVEETLLGHPAVWECAVVEGHDEDGLAQPIAFVVPNVGSAPTPQLGQDLMEYVKKSIAPYKYPRQIEFVDALPHGPDGKVQRWRLRRPTHG